MERFELVDDCPPGEVWRHWGVWDWHRDRIAVLDGRPCHGMLKAEAQQALARLRKTDSNSGDC